MVSNSVSKLSEKSIEPVKLLVQFVEESDAQIFKARDKEEFKDVIKYLLAQLNGMKKNQNIIPKIKFFPKRDWIIKMTF